MKICALGLLFSLSVIKTYAQSEISVFTATGRGGVTTTMVNDYESLGINPANLGLLPENKSKQFCFGLLESGFSIYSDALKKEELKESILTVQEGDTLSKEQKLQAAKQFAYHGVALNADINIIGISLQTQKTGGFAVNVRERISGNAVLGQTASDIIFNGYNSTYFDTVITIDNALTGVKNVPQMISEAFKGTRLSMLWYREYALGYGRSFIKKDNFECYAGVGVKYIQGFGILDLDARGDKLYAMGALSPAFKIDYGNAIPANASTGFKSVGSGMGYEFGFNVVFFKKIKAGFAVTDIGSIKWDKNVLKVNDDTLNYLASSGINGYNIFTELENIMGKEGIFEWEYVPEGMTVKLPTTFRAGSSIKIMDYTEVGLDIIIPLNNVAGSFDNTILAVGGDLKPLPWLKVSSGITTGGNYDYNIPLGLTITLVSGGYECGVATRDIMTLLGETKPTLSLSAGFLRFKF